MKRVIYSARIFFTRSLKKKMRALSFPGQDEEKEQRAYKYLSDCGCKAGSVFLMFFIIGYASWLLLYRVPLRGHLLSYVGFSILSAIVGKLAGIAFFRMKASWLLSKMSLRTDH